MRCRKENGGFGTGHNTVLPELTSDYHFILNPDIQLTADTLSDLADWMAEHPDAVMARPGLRFPDGRPQSLPLRRCALRPMVYRQLPFLKFWEKYNRAYLMEGEDLSAPVEIEFCTGSFSAVRTISVESTPQNTTPPFSEMPRIRFDILLFLQLGILFDCAEEIALALVGQRAKALAVADTFQRKTMLFQSGADGVEVVGDRSY